jgi:regulatory protein
MTRGIVAPMTDRHPDAASLHAAALAHLARYGTTRAGLTRVLDRRVDRWARESAAEDDAVRAAKRAVREVVARLAACGAVDDAVFAESRARSLTRVGRSHRAVAAHLAARGVAGETLRQALPQDEETELAAALALARRRRIGPFRAGAADAEVLRRELGMLARAGFAQDVALRALRMQPDQAEAMVNRLRTL